MVMNEQLGDQVRRLENLLQKERAEFAEGLSKARHPDASRPCIPKPTGSLSKSSEDDPSQIDEVLL